MGLPLSLISPASTGLRTVDGIGIGNESAPLFYTPPCFGRELLRNIRTKSNGSTIGCAIVNKSSLVPRGGFASRFYSRLRFVSNHFVLGQIGSLSFCSRLRFETNHFVLGQIGSLSLRSRLLFVPNRFALRQTGNLRPSPFSRQRGENKMD